MLTYKDINLKDFNPENIETNLTLLGIFALKDYIKEEVPHSIETLRAAGLNVIMCTGDNLDTAKCIAKDCGILADK